MFQRSVTFLLAILITSACSPLPYYQLFKTESNDIVLTGQTAVFENDDIRIIYDFWKEKGNGDFAIFNKTEQNIWIDLSRSHLVLNQFAQTYILKMTPEGELVCIPPQSAKKISGFILNSRVVRDCDLLRFPRVKDANTIKFDENTAPLSIRNIVTYMYDSLGLAEFFTIQNTFWVNEVTNYPSKSFVEKRNESFCQEESDSIIEYFKYALPTSFYIQYPDLSMTGKLKN